VQGERVELSLPGSDRGLGVIRHGHYGRPVLVFPSEGGRAEDFADNGIPVREVVRRTSLTTA